MEILCFISILDMYRYSRRLLAINELAEIRRLRMEYQSRVFV